MNIMGPLHKVKMNYLKPDIKRGSTLRLLEIFWFGHLYYITYSHNGKD